MSQIAIENAVKYKLKKDVIETNIKKDISGTFRISINKLFGKNHNVVVTQNIVVDHMYEYFDAMFESHIIVCLFDGEDYQNDQSLSLESLVDSDSLIHDVVGDLWNHSEVKSAINKMFVTGQLSNDYYIEATQNYVTKVAERYITFEKKVLYRNKDNRLIITFSDNHFIEMDVDAKSTMICNDLFRETLGNKIKEGIRAGVKNLILNKRGK